MKDTLISVIIPSQDRTTAVIIVPRYFGTGIFSNIELAKDNFKQRFSHNDELPMKNK